jgi:hypothetical protein
MSCQPPGLDVLEVVGEGAGAGAELLAAGVGGCDEGASVGDGLELA